MDLRYGAALSGAIPAVTKTHPLFFVSSSLFPPTSHEENTQVHVASLSLSLSLSLHLTSPSNPSSTSHLHGTLCYVVDPGAKSFGIVLLTLGAKRCRTVGRVHFKNTFLKSLDIKIAFFKGQKIK
jgi:hypothetical protein